MRTIKFCGRELDGKQYFTGDLIQDDDRRLILTSDGGEFEVDPNSVAQFTEFLDKDGAEVYDGDYLEIDFAGAAKVIGDGSLIRDLEDSKPAADAKLKVEFSHGRYQLMWRTKNGCVDTGVDLYLLKSVKQFVRRCD